MILFPAQFDGFSTRSNGERILKLSTYQETAEEVSKVTNMDLGTEFMVMLIPTRTEEAESFATETKEETLMRFKRHMESLIADVAKNQGKDTTEFREQFKANLIEKGLIKKSTMELDLEGYAQVINMLRSMNPRL